MGYAIDVIFRYSATCGEIPHDVKQLTITSDAPAWYAGIQLGRILRTQLTPFGTWLYFTEKVKKKTELLWKNPELLKSSGFLPFLE